MYSTLSTDDTIAAIASPAGGACRGIVRVSGPAAIRCVAQCFSPASSDDGSVESIHTCRQPRAFVGAIATTVGKVPCQLLIWPTNRSFTRQPSVEVHTIGSTPILESILAVVCEHGSRIARPGEFTLRAFLAGRIDLTQAEAVLGVIEARGENELRGALDQLAGGFSQPLQTLRSNLLDVLSHLEAGLDFVEEDIEFIHRDALVAQIHAAQQFVDDLRQRMDDRSDAPVEFHVALVGYPNVGKSSLFNAIAETEAAIVSPIAGATRDYLVHDLVVDGIRFTLIDTAGVAEQTRNVTADQSARHMSLRQRQRADLILFCLDATRDVTDWEWAELNSIPDANRIVVLTKCDEADETTRPKRDEVVRTSSLRRDGIELLRKAIANRLRHIESEASTSRGTAARCRESLDRASDGLGRALALATASSMEELVAAELRVVLEHLAEIVGAVYTDDILDRIFSRFCIGK